MQGGRRLYCLGKTASYTGTMKYLLALGTALASVMAAPSGSSADGSVKAADFWYAAMDHTGDFRGIAPHLDNADTYEVFKTVKSGDGGAIQNAIDAGTDGNNRHQQWLSSEPRVSEYSLMCKVALMDTIRSS